MSDSNHDQNTDQDEALDQDTLEVDASEGVGSEEAPSVEETAGEAPDESTPSEDAASLTTDISSGEEESDEPPSNGDEVVPASRFKELQGEFTRRSQRMREIERQNEELQRRYEELTKSQQTQQLPPWSPDHPAKPHFDGVQQKYEVYKQQMGRASTDDERQHVANMWRSEFTDEDIHWLRAFESERSRVMSEMASNPYAFQQRAEENALEQARRMVREEMEQQQQVLQYRQFFQREDVAPIVQKHGRVLKALLTDGMPAEEAVEYLRGLEATNSKAIAEADRKVASAEAQRKLAKGRATAERDRKGSSKADPVDEAVELCRKEGVEPTGRNLADALMRVGRG